MGINKHDKTLWVVFYNWIVVMFTHLYQGQEKKSKKKFVV